METLVLRFKSKKNYKLIKELASALENEADVPSIEANKKVLPSDVSMSSEELKKRLPKSKFKTEAEFRAIGGILKGQLISKEHLRSIAWKKRV